MLVVSLASVMFLAFSAPEAAANLALERPVYYSVAPEHPPEAAEGSKLTDGVIVAPGAADYAHEDSVGFHYGGYGISSHHGISMVVDLEGERVLGSSTIRLMNASAEMVWWRLPKRITLSVSKDGQDFYEVATKRKLLTYGPGGTADGELFAVEERDRSFFYPLTFDLGGVRARYVALTVAGESFVWWADEWQVREAGDGAVEPAGVWSAENRIMLPMGAGGGERFTPLDSVYFGPCKDEVVVSTPLAGPQYLDFVDYRPDEAQAPVTLVMELPEAVRLAPSAYGDEEVIRTESAGAGMRRYRIDVDAARKTGLFGDVARVWTIAQEVGPLFLELDGELPPDARARFYAESGGTAFTAQERPVRTVAIEAVPPIDVFPIGLSWIGYRDLQAWPGGLDTYRKLGFNHVRVSAGYAAKDGQGLREPYDAFVREAESRGLKLTLVDSGVARLHRYEPETKCLNETNPMLCPSYQGEGMDATVEAIRRAAEALDPHNVWWNIEAYGYAFMREGCERCEAGMEESGLGTYAYFEQCGERMLSRLHEAVEVSDRLERVGLYDLWPTRGGRLEGHGMHDADSVNQYGNINLYHDVFTFESVYPDAINTGMPHLYCAGLTDVLHTHMARPGAELLPGKWNHVNVLSTGTFGEFPSFKVEPMVYEQALNEGGIDFYNFDNFDTPLDFHYFTKALNVLAHHQDLLRAGRCMTEWAGMNRRLYYTAFGTQEEQLLLIGNYTSPETEQTRLFLPAGTEAELTNARTGAPVEHLRGVVEMKLEPLEFVVLHARAAEQVTP